MDRLEGAFQILRYNSISCGGKRAVIEVVQIGSKVAGTYRFTEDDSGEVPWGAWPRHDGDIVGEEAGKSTRWRWRLRLAGTNCFARPLEDGRIGLSLRESDQHYDDHLEPIETAPAGDPYRDVVRTIDAMIDWEGSSHPRVVELRKSAVSSMAAALEKHTSMQSILPDAARLVRGEPIDLRMLREAARGEATREERAYFDRMRERWEPRLRDLVPFPEPPPTPEPLPTVVEKLELPNATILTREPDPTDVISDAARPLVNAAKRLVALQNATRGELLVVVRDVTTADGTYAVAASGDTAMVAKAVNAVPFDSLAQVESAWQALRTGLGSRVEAPVQPLRHADLRAALEGWYAETFQYPSQSELHDLIAAASSAGCLFVGGLETRTPDSMPARFALLAGSTVAMLVYYTGDGP
jgi:hypothetical protein